MAITLPGEAMAYSVGIIIISDRASSNERKDACIPVFESVLAGTSYEIVATRIVSDDRDNIESAFNDFLGKKLRLILTCGGTGCGVRDNTPEVTSALLTKPTPGLDEAIRLFSKSKAKFAMFSRGVSGVAGQSFVVNLPGSPKAVSEIMNFLLPTIEHPLKLIANEIDDCVSEINHD